MDQKNQKQKVRDIYLTDEMSVWGENINKEKSKMNWLKDRVKEMSSWSGASLIVLGAFILLGGPFIKLLAWAAIIWGIVSIVKKEG
tara:strand:- start:930 stop:1187 length:258 start_codon:yes stop_codon:yes gene_type:complete